MTKSNDDYRRCGVMLVPVDDQFALIDANESRVLIISPAAAWVWSRLGTDDALLVNDAELAAFVETLGQRQLLQATPAAAIPPVGNLDGPPRILSQTPLQVAANNSNPAADPFLAV